MAGSGHWPNLSFLQCSGKEDKREEKMKTDKKIKVLKEKLRAAKQDRNVKQEEVAELEQELNKLQNNSIHLV